MRNKIHTYDLNNQDRLLHTMEIFDTPENFILHFFPSKKPVSKEKAPTPSSFVANDNFIIESKEQTIKVKRDKKNGSFGFYITFV